MEKLIGIIIPPEEKAKMIDFCTQYDPELTEPYMTLIPHELLVSVKGFDRKLQSFCLSQPPFKTIIGGPNIEITENGRNLYLSVMMGTLNATREKLLKHLKLPPATGVFRTQVLLAAKRPDKTYDFDAMLADAKNVFSKPINISVRELAIYSRKDPTERYKIDSSYMFTGR